MHTAFFFLKHARTTAVGVFISAIFALGATGGDAVCFNGQDSDTPGECSGLVFSNDFVLVVAPLLMLLAAALFFAAPAMCQAILRDGYIRTYHRALLPQLEEIDAYERTDDAVFAEIWTVHEIASSEAALVCAPYQSNALFYELMAEAMVDPLAEQTGCDPVALREAGLEISPRYRGFWAQFDIA